MAYLAQRKDMFYFVRYNHNFVVSYHISQRYAVYSKLGNRK